MLMDDLEDVPSMLHSSLALQATEKSLYDILNNNYYHIEASSSHHFPGSDPNAEISYSTQTKKNKNKSHRYREEASDGDINSNKHLAPNRRDLDSEPLEMYDNEMLCEKTSVAAWNKSHLRIEPGRGRPKTSNKKGIDKEVVDLNGLLRQCADAVAFYDSRTATDLLIRIRHHSSPHGDYTERLAHYFAIALEARLAGTGTELYATFSANRISVAQTLKAYKTLIRATPFRRMSNMLANRTIHKLAEGATALHIIDFGILYGFQWPCLIHLLSERPGGPPKLRVTGIDFPQPGFHPGDRVAESGIRLGNYCNRFGVPFEYNEIAQKWETIKEEDLKIDEGDLLVVNSLYRMDNVPDETVMSSSQRDIVLGLIKKINPDMFILGVTNGTLDSPFFVTRFKEALFQYSCLFDMFDATMKREDENRIFLEGHLYGMEALNIIACEGTQRVERPETYKQWHVRSKRAV